MPFCAISVHPRSAWKAIDQMPASIAFFAPFTSARALRLHPGLGGLADDQPDPSAV
jgi:hypothetical protein